MNLHGLVAEVAMAALLGAFSVPAFAQDTAPTARPSVPATVSVIENHIGANSDTGVYTITDPRSGQDLALSLVEVHTGAHPVESGETYHCADFTDTDGALYDLDFYVGVQEGAPEVVEVLIHKVNGKERLR